MKNTNPYKKVWNSVEDEERSLVEAASNNTLFAPTMEELARRSMSTARYLLAKARKQGRSAEGIETFNNAVFYWKMAKKDLAEHQRVLRNSR